MALARTALFVRRSVGGLFAVEDMSQGTGARIYVHASTGTDAGGYGTSPDKPVATLDYAIGLCTADENDTVYLMPGHTETLIAASTLTMDVAGVRVIGLGQGRLKPQYTITTAAAATWNITAANCTVENVDIISNFLNVAASMTIAATATGTTLRNVRMFDTDATHGSLIGISVAANADELTIDGFTYHGTVLSALATNCILFAGGCDRLVIKDVYITSSFSDTAIGAETAISSDVFLSSIYIYQDHATGEGIHFHATSTGVARDIEVFCDASVGFVGELIQQSFTVRVSGACEVTSMLNAVIDS